MQGHSFEENPINLAEDYLSSSELLPMTNSDVERLIEILELAESREFLHDFIQETDEQPFKSSVKLDSESPEYYKAQQRKAIEGLEAIDKKLDSLLEPS